MQNRYEDVALPVLFLMWAKYRVAKKLEAMRPEITSDEIARATALSGNPPGA